VSTESARGERDAARQLFSVVWADIGGENGDPLQRCAVAHSMADVQDDVNDELMWDLRALSPADVPTDERAAQAGVTIPAIGLRSIPAPQSRRVLPQARRP